MRFRSAVRWTSTVSSSVKWGAVSDGLIVKMKRTRSINSTTGRYCLIFSGVVRSYGEGLTNVASRHCDHNEMALRPIVTARFSTFDVLPCDDNPSKNRLEIVFSGCDGRKKSDKASMDLLSSWLKR